MSSEQQPPNTTMSHGDKTRAGHKVRQDRMVEAAEQRRELLTRASDGTFVAKLSPEDWEDVLERLSMGEIAAHIMQSYGCRRSALHQKCRKDPEFKKRYHEALDDAFYQIAQDARHVVRGEPGYGTGDRERDVNSAKIDIAIAKMFSRNLIGDKVSVEHSMKKDPVVLLPADWTTLLPAPSDDSSGDDDEDDDADG